MHVVHNRYLWSLRRNIGARDVHGRTSVFDSRCINNVAGRVLIDVSTWLSDVGDGVKDAEV